MKLKGKVALVTGASSGIGRQTAVQLGCMGAKVAITGRRADALEETRAEIEAVGAECLPIVADLFAEESASIVKQQVDDHFGGVDYLVLNAGLYVQGRILSVTMEHFERSMTVNFYANLRLIRTFVPSMIKRGGGHIGIVSSMDAKKGLIEDGPYVAAKSALSGMADVLRQELRSQNVYVTTIFPGRVNTPMVDHIECPKVSPKIRAEKVATAILKGMLKKKPEVIVPGVYRSLLPINALSPGLVDTLYRWFKLEGTQIADK